MRILGLLKDSRYSESLPPFVVREEVDHPLLVPCTDCWAERHRLHGGDRLPRPFRLLVIGAVRSGPSLGTNPAPAPRDPRSASRVRVLRSTGGYLM